MSFDEEDPEVIADLKLRAATERDRTRSREPATWSPPRIIDRVPCRGSCGAVVDWPQEAEDQFAMFNRVLRGRMEPPLDKTRIVFCNACKAAGRALAADTTRRTTDAIAKLIRELRTDPGPSTARESEILAKLKPYHPDLPALVESVRARRESKSQGRTRRSAL